MGAITRSRIAVAVEIAQLDGHAELGPPPSDRLKTVSCPAWEIWESCQSLAQGAGGRARPRRGGSGGQGQAQADFARRAARFLFSVAFTGVGIVAAGPPLATRSSCGEPVCGSRGTGVSSGGFRRAGPFQETEHEDHTHRRCDGEDHSSAPTCRPRSSRRPSGKETVAIIGYGVQGRGQSLNMRDNGVKVVIVGVRKGGGELEARRQGRLEAGDDALQPSRGGPEGGTVVQYLLSNAGQKEQWTMVRGQPPPRRAALSRTASASSTASRPGVVPPETWT